MPLKDTTNSYLTCPRLKGQPKKHVSVCHQCRYRKKCVPYRNFCQVELPFDFSSKNINRSKSSPSRKTVPEKPESPIKKGAAEKMLLEIEAELKELRKLCR